MLTPITFVTKDHRVRGDYQIDTDNEGYIPPKPKVGRDRGIHPMTPKTPEYMPTPVIVRTPTPPREPTPPTPVVEPIPETTESEPTPSDYSNIAQKLNEEMRELVS